MTTMMMTIMMRCWWCWWWWTQWTNITNAPWRRKALRPLWTVVNTMRPWFFVVFEKKPETGTWTFWILFCWQHHLQMGDFQLPRFTFHSLRSQLCPTRWKVRNGSSAILSPFVSVAGRGSATSLGTKGQGLHTLMFDAWTMIHLALGMEWRHWECKHDGIKGGSHMPPPCAQETLVMCTIQTSQVALDIGRGKHHGASGGSDEACALLRNHQDSISIMSSVVLFI